MRSSIPTLALTLALFAVPHALAAGAPHAEGPAASPAAEGAETPSELDRSPAVLDASPQSAQCPGFTILRLFPAGTPQQACVDYCTASGGTFAEYDQDNALYWVCSCCVTS